MADAEATPHRQMPAATTRSTAGTRYDFEDQVAAWLLTRMLTGEMVPGANTQGSQIQSQTQALGWQIDDLLVTGIVADGPPSRLAISCKSNVHRRACKGAPEAERSGILRRITA